MNQKDTQSLLSTLNGVLFTGGSAYFNNDPGNFYWPQVLNILSYLREFHRANPQVAIPLWGTCLGFEAIICATAKVHEPPPQKKKKKAGTNIYGTFDAENLAVPINFTSNASESRIFDGTMDPSYSKSVYDIFASQAVSMNNHQGGFSPSDFLGDEYLINNFTLLGTSNDADNVTFITLMESIDSLQLFWYVFHIFANEYFSVVYVIYNFFFFLLLDQFCITRYGSQFHPEKPQYEFDASDATNTPHFYDAIFANQYLSEFFVNECRLRNNNTMSQTNYENSVIYNYNAFYLAKAESDVSYEQVYVFPAAQ
ncbi:hypothetical protein RFI_21642 [Reticulomyxa filosa]|uniref:folate gamma-glutamyl hydrolase n=1 Tax=Reticulomyxa filosa TaxID=46433 RepID=X6MQJ8_RETFI|nr:hypothetical protein RFI_21642 [Reticulomyxa filosa]|eukprot:ETO15722.1 hypothetical protein RFI_21642 [Reticulomyxa filosa]